MDDIFKSSGVHPGNGKQWDGWRSYDKRLVNIASKDPNVKIAVTQRKVVEEDEQEVATAADETENEQNDDGDVGDFEPGGPISSTPQKRSRQTQDQDDEGSVPPFGDIDVNLGLEHENGAEIDREFDEVERSKGKEKASEPHAKKRKTKK